MAVKLTDKQKISAAIAISSCFFICELAVAFKTGSLALMADAFHYLNDLTGFTVTLVSIMIAEAPQFRQDFSFGWQRARLLGAFFNGAFLLALGISIFLQSIERFISVKEVHEAKLILIMGCVGLGLNLITAVFLHDHHHHHLRQHDRPHADPADSERGLCPPSKGTSVTICPQRNHSHLGCHASDDAPAVDSHCDHRHAKGSFKASGRDLGMMGALLHVMGDAINNVGVMIAAVVIWLTSSPGRFYADPAVGMAISLMILGSALPLIRHSGEILLQSAPQGVDLADIKHDIEKIPGIASVHELHVWRLDQKKAIATAHIVVSDPDVASFMDKARTIGECLHAYGIHSTTLQPELAPTGAAPSSSSCSCSPPSSPFSHSSHAIVSIRGETGSRQPTVAAAANPCQILCGNGMCDHLMCCNRVVQK